MKVPFLDLSLQHAELRDEILAGITNAYDGARFCLGRDVEDFERNFCAGLGYPHAVAMNSGTSPLHVAGLLAAFGPGDEVITTPFTFISTVWGVSYCGARPVFCDIEPGTYNLDPVKVEAAVTPKTKAIIVVHLFGQPARMGELLAIAERHKLVVIEDCAQAIGAKYRDVPVGLLGDCGTFSFYPTKNLGGCGEGGAFVSRHANWHLGARQIRVHGSDRRYHHDRIGGNFRMDGFQGAVLNVKLPRLKSWNARRRAIAQRYLAELKLPELSLPEQPAYGASVFHQFTVRHPRRDALRTHLQEREVGTDLIYPVPLHRQACFASLGYGEGSIPIAEAVAKTCVSLPIFPELTDEQVEHVIRTVNSFV
ncbi:MAG TPA: DegT/DnrJ/EryC1/StrS family aminotransferase [Opitutaceae bacterium]|jgi:dTDP-4-amino-4,6-dideoxygalactose transaminase